MQHVDVHHTTAKGLLLLFGFISMIPVGFSQASSREPFPLVFPGTEDLVRYDAYGKFEDLGTENYRYKISDKSGLSKAVGAGIYPNTANLSRDPVYRKLARTGLLNEPLDHYGAEADPTLAYYKWAGLKGIPYQGLRMVHVAESLEEAGHARQALKAYYAVIVHFPKEIAWIGGKPWYVGVAALDAVYRLLDEHPEWDLALQGARVDVENGFDKKVTNDVIRVNPGRWTDAAETNHKPEPLAGSKSTRLTGTVHLVERTNGHWQLVVEGKPYLIRGMAYSPTPVGRSPDVDGYKPHEDWMTADSDNNGMIDSPHQSWVDANRNGIQDRSEQVVGDFELMKKMGVNAVRLYHHGPDKAVLKELSDRFGIRVLMGDLLGAYTVGSEAEWELGTDYADPAQLEAMRESVRDMVLTHKDENYVLLWVLGNENNYGHGNNAPKDPEAFYSFVNSLAEMIHELDPNRPVALCNGDLGNLDVISHKCPQVDVLAINAYRGRKGMGHSFWQSLAEQWRKPVLVSEFGCPAYNATKEAAEAEADQAAYLLSSWSDIERHAAGGRIGNSIGGVIFEWVDEWWKAGPDYDIREQDKEAQARGAFPGGFMYEEWLGITAQGNGQLSPMLRELRPAYFSFQKGPWKKPMNFPLNASALYGKR